MIRVLTDKERIENILHKELRILTFFFLPEDYNRSSIICNFPKLLLRPKIDKEKGAKDRRRRCEGDILVHKFTMVKS